MNHMIEKPGSLFYFGSIMDASADYPAPDTRTREKWGSAIDKGMTGFQIVPDMLIRNQQNLGLDATDIVVLLNILMYWWTKDNLPRPKLAVIARRMGVSKRTVERRVEKMEGLELLKRLPARKDKDPPGTKRFDVNGLVKELQRLADSMRDYEEEYG